MATITNYYEELGLNPEMSIEEIGSKLDQLENVWNQRMFNEPEKANNILTLISEARDKFASVETKSAYDQMLAAPPADESKDNAGRDHYYKAKAETEDYFNSEQWDLAKMAIEKTLSLVPGADIDGSLEEQDAYILALNIYMKNGLFEQALEYANKAIAITPDELFCYSNKELVLYNCIEERKKQNVDYSQLAINYRSTCQVWAKKAQGQNDLVSAAKALYFLAGAYVNYMPKDYDKAEQCATEALKLDPNCEGANSVLKWLNQPKKASSADLVGYFNEPLYYWNEIQELAGTIIHSMPGAKNQGLLLITKKHSFLHGHLKDDTLWQKVEDTYSYSISPNGKFVRDFQRNIESQYHSPGGADFSNKEYDSSSGSTEFNENNISEFLIEFDFTGEWHYYTEWSESSDNIMWISGRAGDKAWDNRGARYELTRNSWKKGYGLYRFLQNIYDKEKDYLEACKEANEKYDAEIEPMKEQITREYSEKRSALNAEMHSKVSEALDNDKTIESLNSQLSSMNAEYSKLGLFSGKRKKELQIQMESVKRQLGGLQSSDQVRQHYQQIISKLDSEEKSAISRAEQAIRAKYPLPQKQ